MLGELAKHRALTERFNIYKVDDEPEKQDDYEDR